MPAFQRSIPGISELADLFKRFPILEMMCVGIHCSVSTIVKQRKLLPWAIVAVFVKRLMQKYNNGFLQCQELRKHRCELL